MRRGKTQLLTDKINTLYKFVEKVKVIDKDKISDWEDCTWDLTNINGMILELVKKSREDAILGNQEREDSGRY